MKKIRNYYRKIAALFPKITLINYDVGRNLIVIFSLFLLSTLCLMLFLIYILQNTLEGSYQEERVRQQRYYYWSTRVEDFPNSPDVLYNAAVSAIGVGKNETALNMLQKAIKYDPKFSRAKELRNQILQKAK